MSKPHTPMRILSIVTTLAVGLLCQLQAKDAMTPTELQAQLYKITPDLLASTVSIQVGGASGSGVIISPDGLILTAAHVTSKPGAKLRILLADGRDLEGTALGVDHSTDAGIARLDDPGPYPFQPYIQEPDYEVGDWVIATGHFGGPHAYRPAPVRLGQINRAGTEGGFTDPITTTAFVISGDSGGPLFDLQGRVIGINSNISGDWNTNNHVPLPCFIPVWDKLMAGENIEGEGDSEEPSVDDPFGPQREYFFEELKARANDPAAYLLKRPELLDPHHIQNHLDRWARESASDDEPFDPAGYNTAIPFDIEPGERPYLGLTFDTTNGSAVVSGVANGSPAEAAAFASGDRITAINSTPTDTLGDLARELSDLDYDSENPAPIVFLVQRSGKPLSITVAPVSTPERRYFRQPLSALSDQMMSRAPAISLSEHLEKIRAAFTAELGNKSPSVITLMRENRPVILATALTKKGLFLTKTSEITDNSGNLRDGVVAEIDGEEQEIELIASDTMTDLSIIRTKASNQIKADWSDFGSPRTSTLVISPTLADAVAFGITTQPVRSAPKSGFDHLLTLGEAPPFLGFTLSETSTAEDHPSVALVEPDSPCDRAGLIEGDVIVSIDDEDITKAKDVIDLLADKQPGETVVITVKRGDQDVDLKAILGKRTVRTNRPDPKASRTDQALSQLSANGGALSKRRQGFPLAIYHDTPLEAPQCGGPLLDIHGQLLGINIARSLRTRTLALPSSVVRDAIKRMLK